MYLENTPWAHEQEEVLRIFAADEKEKRYRFKPMRARQRAFIHSLAEDFGFDGESLDPEPHRHVLLFKTPKFVAAPMKTLAQAARIRRGQLTVQTPVDGKTAPQSRADEATTPDYNGILLKQPRFALTEDELQPIIRSIAPANEFDVIFLSAVDGIALLPRNEWNGQEQTRILLESLQPIVSATVGREGLATSAVLCEFDLNLMNGEPRILHEAGTLTAVGKNAPGGWSQIAAKRSAPTTAPTVPPIGQRSPFMVLASKLAEAKKKQKEAAEMERKRKELQSEPVIDDWSVEFEREEGENLTRTDSTL